MSCMYLEGQGKGVRKLGNTGGTLRDGSGIKPTETGLLAVTYLKRCSYPNAGTHRS
jgi:hypothetical protein